MNAQRILQRVAIVTAALLLTGCVTRKPYDYTTYRQHPPRSILVLPPLNESTAVEATYSYLSTTTRPIAEMGYYVFPVALVDQLLKENGMPGAGEMHQVPLNKVAEIIGADAVLYITIESYGSKYQVVNSATIVAAKARLVDTKTGIVLWEGTVRQQQNSGGSGNILADLVSAAITQAVNSSVDAAHDLSHSANGTLFSEKGYGLLHGPYHPAYNKE